MKIKIIVGILLAGVVAGVSVLVFRNTKPNLVACTMEAKICPDGSAVGRSGPNCEFAQCPQIATTTTVKATTTPKLKGVLTGTVTLSPTCPVERIPPDPACAPKPYAVIVEIRAVNFFIQVHADMSGKYYLELPIGNYRVTPYIESLYPICELKEVSVKSNQTTVQNISCDTGIR
jgi:hypothetical protein